MSQQQQHLLEEGPKAHINSTYTPKITYSTDDTLKTI